MLATPGERGVIGRGQVETQHPEDRRQDAFSLPQGQVEEEPERQRGFDGEIGTLPLPATCADAHGLPSGDRIGANHTVISPRWTSARSDAGQFPTWYFVLYFECTLDCMSRSGTCCRHDGRAWLTEGAGSVHQRHGEIRAPPLPTPPAASVLDSARELGIRDAQARRGAEDPVTGAQPDPDRLARFRREDKVLAGHARRSDSPTPDSAW